MKADFDIEVRFPLWIVPVVGVITYLASIYACSPAKPPVGIEYCDSAAARIVYLACTSANSARVANACRMALSDARDWHPQVISSASTCASVSALIEGRQ